MEELTLIGRAGRDPETRTTPGSQQVTEISLAVDRRGREGQKTTVWYTVEAWERLGQIVAQYVRRGSQVWLRGRPRADAWTDREGQLRSRIRVTAERLELLGSKGDAAAPAAEPTAESVRDPQTGYDQVEPDELPF